MIRGNTFSAPATATTKATSLFFCCTHIWRGQQQEQLIRVDTVRNAIRTLVRIPPHVQTLKCFRLLRWVRPISRGFTGREERGLFYELGQRQERDHRGPNLFFFCTQQVYVVAPRTLSVCCRFSLCFSRVQWLRGVNACVAVQKQFCFAGCGFLLDLGCCPCSLCVLLYV